MVYYRRFPLRRRPKRRYPIRKMTTTIKKVLDRQKEKHCLLNHFGSVVPATNILPFCTQHIDDTTIFNLACIMDVRNNTQIEGMIGSKLRLQKVEIVDNICFRTTQVTPLPFNVTFHVRILNMAGISNLTGYQILYKDNANDTYFGASVLRNYKKWMIGDKTVKLGADNAYSSVVKTRKKYKDKILWKQDYIDVNPDNFIMKKAILVQYCVPDASVFDPSLITLTVCSDYNYTFVENE